MTRKKSTNKRRSAFPKSLATQTNHIQLFEASATLTGISSSSSIDVTRLSIHGSTADIIIICRIITGKNKNYTPNNCTCKKYTPKKFTKNLSTEEKLYKNNKNNSRIKNPQKKESTGKKVHKEKIHIIIFSPTKK